MNEFDATRDLLLRHLDQVVAADPLGAIAMIVELQRETDVHLREAVRQATADSSWSEIAAGLGVSKQAAHHRFKTYAKEVAAEIKTEHRAMKQSRRDGDAVQAATARAHRDKLVADLRSAADALKASV